MTRTELIEQIRQKKSCLCVGLDPDTEKIPSYLMEEEDPIFEFNKAIVDATAPHCVAFKPNTAFYEAYGISGMTSLEKTIRYIRTNYPEQFVIADAKRGDIGNTSAMYAKAFFKKFSADAVTVAPYMGADSVKPFLTTEGKWAVVLALTSNEGAADFQNLVCDGKELFVHVIEKCLTWGTPDNLMFVVGATRADMVSRIRRLVPDHFLLVPGVGAQGGDLRQILSAGVNKDCGILINASRSILYASAGKDFAAAASQEAASLTSAMREWMN
jgi:orotidine-5'-phosphate decarboxylase